MLSTLERHYDKCNTSIWQYMTQWKTAFVHESNMRNSVNKQQQKREDPQHFGEPGENRHRSTLHGALCISKLVKFCTRRARQARETPGILKTQVDMLVAVDGTLCPPINRSYTPLCVYP